MASRALIARFMMTCSICPPSALTVWSPCAGRIRRSTSLPRTCWSMDFSGIFHKRIRGREIGKQELALADDGGDNAVEFVCDARCKLAHGFEFLGLKQLS